MRIWSLHPSHLDRIGLVACWRETLLAQAVLAGRTRGYHHHPQLERFRAHEKPLAAIGAYLAGIAAEARQRGYRFDASRILIAPAAPHETGAGVPPITLTTGQLAYEWEHLGRKLHDRSPDDAACWRDRAPSAHPLFTVIPGDVEPWERPAGAASPASPPNSTGRPEREGATS